MNSLLIDEDMQVRDHLAYFLNICSAFASGLRGQEMSPARFESYLRLQRYTFDDHDLARYLIRKQAWEVIGWCGDSSHCFLMEALRSKYPELETAHTDLDPLPYFVIPGPARMCHLIPLSPEMLHALVVFDHTGSPGQAITKSAFLDAWMTTERKAS